MTKGRMFLSGASIAAVVVLLAAFSGKAGNEIDPPFPSWVFGHVVWEDESTTEGTYALVQGYLEHGIPVDGVIIDSPWETAYNNFEWDEELYPQPQKLIDDLHRNDVYVTMWITEMVNFEDPGYDYALENSFFIKGAEELTWWKGTGGMINYENPEAVEWWHARMDKALDMGIDAWKCDGTDPYSMVKGPSRRRVHSDNYYEDFYYYSREHTGRKVLVMARPKEQVLNESVFGLPTWTNPLGVGVYLRYAPVNTSFMSWVGDQDPTFDGLKIASRWILDSAKKDYLIIGSDIGGYRAPGPEKEVFIRWAQFGSLCPFMENGGHNEHRPWMFDRETMIIYRTYTLLHKMLLPYLYTEAVEGWQNGHSIMKPLPGLDDRYLLGRDVFVSPIQSPGGKKKVRLPKGDNWMPLFADESYLKDAERCLITGTTVPLLKGGCSFTRTYDLGSYPVFFRSGSLIPIKPEAAPGLFRYLPGIGSMEHALLLIPYAPGEEKELQRSVYIEGKEPVLVEAKITSGAEVTEHIATIVDAKWPVIVVSAGWPSHPENVPAIEWR